MQLFALISCIARVASLGAPDDTKSDCDRIHDLK